MYALIGGRYRVFFICCLPNTHLDAPMMSSTDYKVKRGRWYSLPSCWLQSGARHRCCPVHGHTPEIRLYFSWSQMVLTCSQQPKKLFLNVLTKLLNTQKSPSLLHSEDGFVGTD